MKTRSLVNSLVVCAVVLGMVSPLTAQSLKQGAAKVIRIKGAGRYTTGDGVVRLGLPEDFAAYRLTELLSDFVRSRPTLRLDVRSGLSVQLRGGLERGELDLALLKAGLS